MSNQIVYFQCEYCGQQYTKEQFQSLQSSFGGGFEDEEVGEIICGNCQERNDAIRYGGVGGSLDVAEKVKNDIPDKGLSEYDPSIDGAD